MTRYASNDTPVTDAELEQFYGKDVTIHIRDQEAANHVCRAIRDVKGGIHLESMTAIVSTLAQALLSSGERTHDDVKEVVEMLDQLHDTVEFYVNKRMEV